MKKAKKEAKWLKQYKKEQHKLYHEAKVMRDSGYHKYAIYRRLEEMVK